jgi:hypothetical protein
MVCSTHGVRIEMHTKYWWESQKERDHYEDLDVDERIILKWLYRNRMECYWLD